MDNLLNALLIASIPLSCIAILLSCISIAVVVGFKNSTHKIEWKTYDPIDSNLDKHEEAYEDESMFVNGVNPNKRIDKKAEPFTPFVAPKEEDEPFYDENDPNNISHDWN